MLSGNILSLLKIFVKRAEDEATVKADQAKPIPIEKQQIDEERAAVLKNIADHNFNIEFLKTIKDNKNIDFYINSLLKPISSGKGQGIGSGRIVYDLGDKVLKYGYNDSGIYQNYQEARIANRHDKFADVYELGPDAKWILSEKVQGFSSPDEFRVYTGVPVEAIKESSVVRQLDQEMLEYLRARYDLEPDALDFIRDFANIHRNFNTIIGDLLNYEHWGVANDGSVKLYDYGLDKEGYDKMYQGGVFKGNIEDEEVELNKMLDQRGIPEEHKNMGVIELAN